MKIKEEQRLFFITVLSLLQLVRAWELRGEARREKENVMAGYDENGLYHEEDGELPITDVTVKLVGEDGNAFSILGKVRTALRRAGYDNAFIEEFAKKATSGDYMNLLAVVSEYVHIE